jgi:hypothetical protein
MIYKKISVCVLASAGFWYNTCFGLMAAQGCRLRLAVDEKVAAQIMKEHENKRYTLISG